MKQYIVITGASSGIGKEAAKVFAAHGKNLVLVARRQERLKQLKEEIQRRFPEIDVMVQTADLSKPEEAYRLYESLKPYTINTWINNAGRGYQSKIADQDSEIAIQMIRLNVEALTILSTLYAHDHQDMDGTQLINVSSVAGYMIFPDVVTYSASKYYVSAFTEGLAQELKNGEHKLQAKVLAPAAVQTEFAQVEQNMDSFDYDKAFPHYHTAAQMAQFLWELYESDKCVGSVKFEPFAFCLDEPHYPYLG